jgi:hypothetical protein
MKKVVILPYKVVDKGAFSPKYRSNGGYDQHPLPEPAAKGSGRKAKPVQEMPAGGHDMNVVFETSGEYCPALSGSFKPMGGKPMLMGTCPSIPIHILKKYPSGGGEYFDTETREVPGLKCIYDLGKRANKTSPCRAANCKLRDGRYALAIVPEEPELHKRKVEDD